MHVPEGGSIDSAAAVAVSVEPRSDGTIGPMAPLSTQFTNQVTLLFQKLNVEGNTHLFEMISIVQSLYYLMLLLAAPASKSEARGIRKGIASGYKSALRP